MGKGSDRRPESNGSYGDNYDAIFCGKKAVSEKAKAAAEAEDQADEDATEEE